MSDQDRLYTGPGVDDRETFDRLPETLRRRLESANGWIEAGGALHVRGACREPAWHSLAEVWTGERALSARYSTVLPGDVPFGQNALGDQFLLRDGRVLRLFAEVGELADLGVDLETFLACPSPEHLGAGHLERFRRAGGTLRPGELLMSDPPLCMEDSPEAVELRAAGALERLDELAVLSRAVRGLPDGTQIELGPDA